MQLVEPNFVSIEEAVRRLETSLVTLKWNIEKGHVRVYVKTPAAHKRFSSSESHEYARVENATHWYDSYERNGDKQTLLAFRRLIILDSTWNEIQLVDEPTARGQSDLFIYLPEFGSGTKEERKKAPPEQKLQDRLFSAKEQMRIWLRNGEELLPTEYADRILEAPRFAGLNRKTLAGKAREMLNEEGREDLIPKEPGRPKKK